MEYIILFLEGIITFISPCMLPMLPIYISYFTGNDTKNKNALKNAVGFVLGFTIVFVMLGAFAGTIGRLLTNYSKMFNLISGIIVILFGLNFMEVIRIPFINQNRQLTFKKNNLGFFSSIVFGIVFSIGWTPCVGVFLGSALMQAASDGGSIKGIFLLLSFSMGLGIPFMISAVLIDRLKTSFDFIKKHYRIINLISGIILVIIGVLMATGFMGYFLSLFTF